MRIVIFLMISLIFGAYSNQSSVVFAENSQHASAVTSFSDQPDQTRTHCNQSHHQPSDNHHSSMMNCDIQCAMMSCVSGSHPTNLQFYHWPLTSHLLSGHRSTLQLQSRSEPLFRPPITA
ncbi:hypothetical protein [Oceanospirillum sediminis]|uniref:DUF2946 domain-containing protein n=1 Tax=Oceanospirillum sediminis TaxID=2760088 RepID=A0A839IVE1_9GAMM|nr:hypothetical protein [Oceanospirillum sediminis]MBB1489413.1 hypothetical protein [Oceanospirillum sediminis]